MIVVDKDESTVKAMRQYTENAFVADDLSKATLSEIGMQNCDAVIVGIGEQIDTSILTAMHLVDMGVKRVIAKAKSIDQGAVLAKIGAEVVYPERDMALRLAKRLISASFLDYLSADNSIEIGRIEISDKLEGRTIEEIAIRQRFGLNIIAIENDGTTNIEIGPKYKLIKGDAVIVIGKVDNIDKFSKSI